MHVLMSLYYLNGICNTFICVRTHFWPTYLGYNIWNDIAYKYTNHQYDLLEVKVWEVI